MPDTLAASISDLLLGLSLAPADLQASNRLSLEGLTFGPGKDGGHEIGMRSLEATSLQLASGPLMLKVGRLALHNLVAQLRMEGGRPRLCALQAARAELSGVTVQGPLILPKQAESDGTQAAAGSWSLGPLAAADGSIRAKIQDAHLLFDAEVTVPVRQGKVDLGDASVEHVGPDSRLGVSRLGLYVDAPNGRSYLYQFSSAPVPGVEYERRGAVLGPWVTERGSLQLQAFAEWLLRQPWGGQALGVTEQARLLFDRTAVSGDVQLGDASFAAPGVKADVVGRADGRNKVRLHSDAVGRGLTLEMASLSVRNAVLGATKTQMHCDDITAALVLRLFAEGAQLRFAFDLARLNVAGLRLDLHRSPNV
jgi:hypothetical protein